MTFITDKNTPISKKIILVEIDIPTKGGELDVLLNHEAGIWFTRLAPGVVTPEDDYGVFGYYENTTVDDELDVGSVIVKDVSYIKVESLEELRIQQESFYYDETTTDLYIHFDAWHKPVGYRYVDYITIGAVTGYSNISDDTQGAYYDDIYFAPRVKSVPSLTKKKDPLFYGLVSFNGGNIVFENSDGHFDNFRDLNIYNQPVRIYMGFEGYTRDDMRQVFAGFVDSYSWNFSEFTIKVADPRKKLQTPLPTNAYNQTDYPDIDDGDVDKLIPIVYGRVNGVECKCLNPDAPSGDYTFKVMDTEYHAMTEIHAAYVDDVEETPVSYSLANGTVTMARALGTSGVYVDVTGADIHNAAAIVQDLMDVYAGYEFIQTNYNTLEFNRVKSRARNGHLYIEKTTPLIKAIEQCCVASDFAFLVQDDGKFTLREYVSNRVPNRTIYNDEILGDSEVSIEEDKFLSSVIVQFNHDYRTKIYEQHKNDTYSAEVIRRYKGQKSKEVETTLVDRASATAKSENIMEFSRLIREQVKITTKTQNIDLEIMDFVIAEPLSRGDVERWAIYEIIGIGKDLSKFEVTLDLQHVAWYTPEESETLQGGVLWYEYLWGHKLYQIAEEL